MKYHIYIAILLLAAIFSSRSLQGQSNVICGDQRMEIIIPLLKNKKIGLVVNQTSVVNRVHLVDTLISRGIKITKIFAPEHGFRGEADAGEKIKDAKDNTTGIPILSLYGDKKNPNKGDMDDIDIIVFDIQDVGARFYTYISTLYYILKACSDYDKQLLILDRPNPNGHYMDGPVLDLKYKSFVGIAPIPVVHGMTVGEFARMAIGEGWIGVSKKPNVKIIHCKNYSHQTRFEPLVRPSPNLPDIISILWYPTLCFFEGTPFSVGRGTNLPFKIVGHPDLIKHDTIITIESSQGAKFPPLLGEKVKFLNLSTITKDVLYQKRAIDLDLILSIYKSYSGKSDFFLKNLFWDKLAGTDQFRKDIISGKSARQIRSSWEINLKAFTKKRKKYLLYKE